MENPLDPPMRFAYWKAPQASTEFSPFKLIYGHDVRGPMDVLSEIWQLSEKSSKSVVSHRMKLEEMRKLARVNFKNESSPRKSRKHGMSKVPEIGSMHPMIKY